MGEKRTKRPELFRFKSQAKPGEVDQEQGIIFGVSVIRFGREAEGHGVYIDETFADQIVKAGKKAESTGVKARFDHPNACARALGTFVGRLHKFRRDEGGARADLHIAEAAAISPDGDLKAYILKLAEEDPDAFATSIVFRPDTPWRPDSANKGKRGSPGKDDPFWMPHARLKSLTQCDVVDEGAANDGLFGRPNYMAEQVEKWAEEHEGMIAGWLDRYFETKRVKQGEVQMEIEEVQEQLTAMTTERDALQVKVDGIEDIKTASLAEGVAQGKKDMLEVIKGRIEKYDKDAAFVFDTLALSEDEVKDKRIEALKVEKKKVETDGAEALEVGSDGNEAEKPAPKTPGAAVGAYETKVAEAMAADATLGRGNAMAKVARAEVALHEDWQKRGCPKIV